MVGGYWRYQAKTIEPSTCGDDAAFLSNYFDRLLHRPTRSVRYRDATTGWSELTGPEMETGRVDQRRLLVGSGRR